MSQQVHVQGTDISQIAGLGRRASSGLYDRREQIETELRDLRIRIEDLRETVSADGSAVGNRIREVLDELLVKQEAVCWKVRVAKRFAGEAREALVADILESVNKLDIAVSLVARAYGDVLQVI
jgi:oligoribonuclease (3'-5' exoribonuclease)